VIIELFGLTARFKDASFAAEDDWRLVHTPPIDCVAGHLEFVDYGAWLKPFLRCRPWGRVPPLVSVTCGPSLNGELSVAAVRLLLQRNEFLPMKLPAKEKPAVDVRRSRVAFRYSR
jgi:hypothetical protein